MAHPIPQPTSPTTVGAAPLPLPTARYDRARFVVTMKRNRFSRSDFSEDEGRGSRNPRPVTGSVGDSCMILGFGRAVREVEPEKRDWSRFR